MNVVVVGGHTRNIGKTSVMAALIREFAPLNWIAVKITQYGHGICSRDGHACDCAPEEHPFALTEERDSRARSDTSRFLAAGARRSLWLRARQGQLGEALPLLTRKLTRAPWVVIESNSIVEFIDPLLYLVVVDRSRHDFKTSAERWLGRADALIPVEKGHAPVAIPEADAVSRPAQRPAQGSALQDIIRSKPSFPVRAPDFWSSALTAFVRDRIAPTSNAQPRSRTWLQAQ
jgi:hypothetical protein